MYREASKYRGVGSYEGFRREMAEVPPSVVERQLELRFEDAAMNFILTIIDPDAPMEEVDLATLDLALVAQADAEINPEKVDSAFDEPWLYKARTKLLDMCSELFDEKLNPIDTITSTVFFSSDYMNQQMLKTVSSGRTSPRFTYDEDTFATGVAMGRIGVSS